MKYITVIIITFLMNSCSYPDIDTVPDFKKLNLSDQEIYDYCSNIESNKKNIDKCIIDYKSNNKL